jgi:hypothetical protein
VHLKGQKVAVGVQQGQVIFDAARSDQCINRFANGDALAAQQAVVL